MDTDTLVRTFEEGTLPASSFHHADHVRLTCAYLDRYGPAEALRRLADGLRRFAARAGKPEKFDAALTRAWLDAIAAARRAHPAAETFEALVALRPDLLDRSSVRVER